MERFNVSSETLEWVNQRTELSVNRAQRKTRLKPVTEKHLETVHGER